MSEGLTTEAIRELLRQADWWHHRARAADDARQVMNISKPVMTRRGRFGFLRRGEPADPDTYLTFERDGVGAIRDALAIVRDEAESRAKELEQQVEDGGE